MSQRRPRADQAVSGFEQSSYLVILQTLHRNLPEPDSPDDLGRAMGIVLVGPVGLQREGRLRMSSEHAHDRYRQPLELMLMPDDQRPGLHADLVSPLGFLTHELRNGRGAENYVLLQRCA